MADKARGRDQTFNWETATYGEVYCDDSDLFTDFETDFPAIAYNDASKSNQNVSSEPTEPSERNNNVGGVFINLEISKCWSLEIPRRLFNTPFCSNIQNGESSRANYQGRYKDQKFKGKSFDAIKKMFDKAYKQVNDFVHMDIDSSGKKAEYSKRRTRAVLGEESVKRQKVEDDAEKAKLKAYLEIVPNDDSAVNIESLDTKYSILFSAMLDDFDRQDVLDLYRLVKERFKTTSPKVYDRLLWGDLITLFEPSEEDEIWKTQKDYTLISWKLYDSCGVHLLLMDTGSSIHMLVEKKYPLTQEMLSRMLSGRLEVDHKCEMAFELLRFTRSQLKK
ncbi:hypothetical protein Tco_1376003 [Tanacetum coccineum]